MVSCCDQIRQPQTEDDILGSDDAKRVIFLFGFFYYFAGGYLFIFFIFSGVHSGWLIFYLDNVFEWNFRCLFSLTSVRKTLFKFRMKLFNIFVYFHYTQNKISFNKTLFELYKYLSHYVLNITVSLFQENSEFVQYFMYFHYSQTVTWSNQWTQVKFTRSIFRRLFLLCTESFLKNFSRIQTSFNISLFPLYTQWCL